MWDSREVEKVDEAMGRFSISCRFKVVFSTFEWGFTGVYGPHRDVGGTSRCWHLMGYSLVYGG